jgi:DNA-binding transcriptional MocR family regulator
MLVQTTTANTGSAATSQTSYGCDAAPHNVQQTATRIERLTSSPVREILSVANRSDIISFAGGLPDQASFPALTLDDTDISVLQYGASEGEEDLREWIAEDMRSRDLPVTASQILILSGSQQGIDLVAKMFIEPQALVAVESPTYLAALQVFGLFGASYLSFRPGSYQSLASAKPVMTYCIPTFQNPTGYCYTQAQRIQLANICEANGSVLFEDDPYRDLVYGDCDRQPVCSYMEQGNWIYQSSFSKTLAPGLRLGYLACSPSLYPVLSRLKQAADLHSNRLSQQLVLSLLTRTDYRQRLTRVTAAYREKRDYFDSLLQQYFVDLADWARPDGGLFFWLKLAANIDTRGLLQRAIANGVAFMPGEPFYPEDNNDGSYIRLNFSHASARDSAVGLKILAELIKAESVGNN